MTIAIVALSILVAFLLILTNDLCSRLQKVERRSLLTLKALTKAGIE